MLKTITRKSIALFMLILTILSACSNLVFAATQISSAQVKSGGDCGYHLQFYDTKQGSWSYIITTFAFHEINGKQYPAYCLQRDIPGVGTSAAGDYYQVNVDQVMQDVRLWRIAINGYPYQSPQSMGLENKYDAFVATKQSVYCIIYGTDPTTYYRGGDARGEAIKNAIINLVNIGRYGSQTPSNTQITANKIGTFYEDGNYYSQEYYINSPVETSNYSIISTAGLPDGSQITNMNNDEQSNFNGIEHFKVRIPKTQITADLNVTVALQAKCKNYPVFYGKTTISGTQDYMLTFDPFGDVAGVATLNVKTNTGKVKVVKSDVDTKQPIAGVTFELQKRNGEVIGNATTNANGEASFSNLYQDTYVLKEIATNEKYILNNTPFETTVYYDKTTEKNITNKHKEGDLKVYKVDKDNHKIALGNVKFDLYSEEFGKVIGTYTTNVDGEITIRNLRIGNYKLIEKNTGKWYNLAKDTNVKVEWNKENPITVENELKKGQVKVIKVDQDNKEIKLEGVQFEVLDNNNKVLEKITTDKNGEALTARYPIRDFEKLKLRESKTLENYVLSDKVQTITLKEDQIETIKFENEKKKGQVKVIKVDLDNKTVKIPNVEFKVYDEQGNVVDTLITDKNGEATSKRLPIDQKYKVQETKTGEWYVLNDKPKTVTLTQDQITNMVFTNEKKKGQIRVIKVDLDNKEVLLEGVTFDILDEQKNVVDTIKTNVKGEATTKRLPIDQKYTAVEKETKKEYVLTDKTQTVTLKQNEIKSITFENEKIKGYLEITKVDSKTKKTLKGAKFGIYNEDDKQVATIETKEDGKATSEKLPYGKYYAKELDTGSPYYLLNEKSYEFEIVKDGETVPLTIDNEPTDITVEVDKKGTVEIKPGEDVNYEFSNVMNNSNVYLDNFKWFDYIPTDHVRLQKMTTGTWNQDLKYKVYYKTNKSEDYILFKENLDTKENYDLDFTEIELSEDEYITETMYDFGKVEKGFKEDTKPTMNCKSFDTLEDNQTFTNHTRTVGTYFGVTADADSKWTTIVHKPKEHHEEKLPRTGK